MESIQSKNDNRVFFPHTKDAFQLTKKPLSVLMLKAQQIIVIITATIVTDYTFLTQIEEIMQNKKRKLKNTP